MSKPELGKVAVGDRLFVIPVSRSRYGNQEAVNAEVVKAGRVWIELVETEPARSFERAWRLRLDTQDDGGTGNYHDRFVTAEQYEWEQRTSAADAYLREMKIRPDFGSPWGSPEQRLVLANLLRQHDGLDPL